MHGKLQLIHFHYRYHRDLRHQGQPPTDATLSAQNLIDAIVIQQMSQRSTEPGSLSVNRDLPRSGFVSRLF